MKYLHVIVNFYLRLTFLGFKFLLQDMSVLLSQ